MKRLFVIPIMFIYLLAVSGVMIHAHYCGQELESWNVFAENKGCADGGCDDELGEPDGCCQDKVVEAKVSYDQNIASVFKIKSLSADWQFMPQPAFQWQNEPVSFTQATLKANRANAPPGRWQHIPLYKLHSSFTYYG